MTNQHYELVVCGGGASGTAAAISASRMGVKTLLLEKAPEIGGTAVWAGVNVWEMGVSGSGLCWDIYRELRKTPSAVGIYSFGYHCCWQNETGSTYPGAQLLVDPNCAYAQTLRRYGSEGLVKDELFARKNWHGVPFEPLKYVEVLRQMLYKTGCCSIWTDAEIVDVEHSSGTMKSAVVLHGGEYKKISADYWIDSTADSHLCSMLGCHMLDKVEDRETFGEIDAPLAPSDEINGVSLIFRISKGSAPGIPPPVEVRKGCSWSKYPINASITQYPNGDWNVNMLPTMEGKLFRSMAYEDAYQECVSRVWAYWDYLQAFWQDFRQYRIVWIAPRIGVREGPRTVCEYMLTEQDILAGVDNQPHPDIIAIADHAIDVHNSVESKPCSEVKQPYGIPFRCLLPKGFENVLVASRGAGFSHIAAASCRLTRTMIILGQAAGTSIALVKDSKGIPKNLEPKLLISALENQNVILDYRKLADQAKVLFSEEALD